jgi:hypothetical protein
LLLRAGLGVAVWKATGCGVGIGVGVGVVLEVGVDVTAALGVTVTTGFAVTAGLGVMDLAVGRGVGAGVGSIQSVQPLAAEALSTGPATIRTTWTAAPVSSIGSSETPRCTVLGVA